MVSDIDPETALISLFTTNWNSSNTDNLTPGITKITSVPKDMDYDTYRDYILIYNPSTQEEEVGIGNNSISHVHETVNIDVRSWGGFTDTNGLKDDAHFRKVITEVTRILKGNKVNFDSNFSELDSTSNDWVNFNDRTRGIYRKVKPVILIDYCREQVT